MASREERAKLRAAHAQKMASKGEQPTNHATFDTEIPEPVVTPVINTIEPPTISLAEDKLDTNQNNADHTTPQKTESQKQTRPQKTKEEKQLLKDDIKKKREDWKAAKVKALAKYEGDKKTVKVVANEESIKYWIKQSRKNAISQQDYLALMLLDTIDLVKKGKLTDESEEVLEYQKVLRNMGAPVNAMLPVTLIDEVKDAAAELCMKQSGFFAFTLNKAREDAQ